jgi:hypothetical protein
MSPQVEKWRPTPTFWVAGAALVIALAAFAVSVSGVATASPKVVVRKGDIAPGAVTTKALAKGAVTGPKIQKATITAAKLGTGSVTASILEDGSVTASKLASGSVTSTAIGPDAVTAPSIAPGSVYGGSLGAETVVTKPISDLDAVAHNGEWTPSNTEAAQCGPGEALLGTGFAMTNPGDGQASWLEALPIINGETRAVLGKISTDSGGTAAGEIIAICLK